MWKTYSDRFFGLDCEYDAADIVLFGAPYDGTTSFRPGTRFASRAMRSESFGLESYSPYLDRDLFDYHICDAGDLELSFGRQEPVLADIEARASAIFADGKLPLMIGGEHLVTLGAVRAAVKQYPDLCIVHFDAHTDLREEYLGETLSHATVIRRCWDLLGDGRIHQFGIRSGDRPEFEWAKTHTALHKFHFEGLEGAVAALRDKPVYFTIDLDVLDPSVFPGTGTPEAGGVGFTELLDAVRLVCSLNVVGCDICELSPVYDASGASTAVALKALRELVLGLCR